MTIHLFAPGDRTKTIAGILVLAAAVVIAAPTAARAAESPRTAALYEGIGMGDKPSKRVRTLQRALTGRGYSVGAPGIDGRFGPLTAGAVRRFQADSRLLVDGIVGPRTRRVLGLSTRTRPGQRPNSGARRTRPRRPRTSPPQAQTSPPQAQTNPPQAQTNSPQAQTSPPQARTTPPQAQTSPPQRDARPPSTTSQNRPAAKPAPGRDLEADRPSPWRWVLIAGLAGVLIAAMWALGRAMSRRVARRAAVAPADDRARAREPNAQAASLDASQSEAPRTAAEGSETETPAGGGDAPATTPAVERDSESPEATPVGEPRRGQASPRFRASAGGGPAATEPAAQAEPVDRRLIGYVTVERSVNGDKLHSQARAIDEACEQAGWHLLAIVRDAEGGRTFDRPGLRYALERIADGEAAGLIVSDLKLLSRSVVDLGSLLAWFWDAGAALIALDLGVDTSTREGHHAASALITLSAWERERTAQGAGLRVAEERPGGRDPDAGWLADRPDLVERIASMKHHGMTLRAIANQLNAEQVPTVRGGTEWRASTVQAVLHYHRGRSWPREQLPSPTRRFR
jgi:DNA invertase Pin-like site-specific DNA recombinase/peptidoglycan hydrolase-like protein with peptidoglycan-binding domain